MLTFQTDLSQFNRTLGQYIELSGKTASESVVKQGTKVAYALYGQFRKLMPEKGSIRAERLAALRAGDGVKIRKGLADVVRERNILKRSGWTDLATRKLRFGKAGRSKTAAGLNLQALTVKAELGLRERGRGYLAFAALFKRLKYLTNSRGASRAYHTGRYQQKLADAGLAVDKAGGVLTINYGGPKSSAGSELAKHPARVAIALREVRNDMIRYIERKLREARLRGAA